MQQNNLISLEQAVDHSPLTVSPEIPLEQVIELMSQNWTNSCLLAGEDQLKEASLIAPVDSSCVLAIANDQLLGIFTEGDLVRLISTGRNLNGMTLAEVMTRNVITLTKSKQAPLSQRGVPSTTTKSQDIFAALNLLRQHQIRHLPIIDENNQLLGLITQSSLRKALQSGDLLKLRTVREVMSRAIHALPNVSVLEVAQLMADYKVSCIPIVETGESLKPIGIITERDIVQFQLLELNIEEITAQTVMSTPLFLAKPEDSLWAVQQDMEQHLLRRLVVAGEQGKLLGVVTQSSLLQAINPIDLQGSLEILQSRVRRLERERIESLQIRNAYLAHQVEKQASELQDRGQREQLVAEISLRIRQSLELESILNTTVAEVRQLMEADRVLIYRFEPDWTGIATNESVSDSQWSILNRVIKDSCFEQAWIQPYQQGHIFSVADIYQSHLSQCHIEFLASFQVRANIAVPILLTDENATADRLWGLLIVHQCSAPRNWQESELELMQLLATQVAIAIQQGELYQQVQAELQRREKVEADMQKSNQLLQAISWIQTQFLVEAEPEMLFDGMLNHLLELTESEYGFIGEIIFTADGSPIMEESYMKVRSRPYLKTHAITNIAWNEETRAFYAENAPKGMEFHNLQTLFGAVIVTGEPVIANSPSTDPRRGGLPDGHPPLNAFLGVPFYKNDEMTGMVGIANREGGYDEAIVSYLQPFLATCSRIIEAYRNNRQKKQAEAKILQQATLLNIATDAIMVRGLDNHILFWNQGAEKLYGWTKAEALKGDANELLYPESSTELNEIQQAVGEKGEWQGELNQVTKAGKEIVVESRWTLVRDETGNPSSFLVVNTDISQKKQLESQFLRTQRLESLGTLAGGIAHDLNNILTPILGFAQLLPRKLTNLDEPTLKLLKIIETNAKRGKALVKQILTFARGLECDRGTIQIIHLIREMRQVINETFPKTIELEIDTPRNLWTIEGDATQIHQVLMNLAVNARDAMPNGGKLRIAAENFPIDANFARLHLEAHEGAYVLVTVADTGMGIPAVIIDRIFEPFFTTKQVGHGTGLGLSTAIGIIKSHGGFIDVYSEVERGTQFKIFLPASETAEVLPVPEELPHANGELILLVDDETQICEVAKATLETFNYKVLTANNGIDALAIYAQNQNAINLVLTDIMMPSMDGKTLIRTIKKINPNIKIVVFSGLVSHREIVAELDDKIAAFINKPYTTETLLKTLHQVVS
ncbi:MAG: CBS domain-containing protein [Xenococcaceae cyanobacterium MO_167.B27]|nr:CBS domain-containing protein [Xenococcaceae cyanobacterium MO_167.B27]